MLNQIHGERPGPRAIRILAIDGGGVRGIIPAVVLGEIERRTGRHPAEIFDVVAGASTGSILAMSLAVPGEDGRPRHTAASTADAYETYVPKIFPRARWSQVRGLVHEKYSAEGLETALEEFFGNARLSHALVHTLVPAYDLVRQDIDVFDTLRATRDQEDDLLMRLVVRGATAAPTYFDPLVIEPPNGTRRRALIDGGLFANNPGMIAFTEVGRHHTGADVIVISLGTGQLLDHSAISDACHDWGLAQWARPLLHLVASGTNQTIDHELRHLLGENRYLRFQVPLPQAAGLDDATPANLRKLRGFGERLVRTMSAELDRACDLILR